MAREANKNIGGAAPPRATPPFTNRSCYQEAGQITDTHWPVY